MPQPELLRSLASPVPSQMTLGSEGATATAPVEEKSCLSVSAVKAPPLSTVFMSPPCAVAT